MGRKETAIATVPTPDPFDEEDRTRRLVIDATAKCVEKAGFDGATIDEIARESGISRTTIYRRFGGREALLTALIDRMTGPYQQRCAAIAAGPGNLTERIERTIVASIASIDDFPWLKSMLAQGLSRTYLDLFSSVQRSHSMRVLWPMLEAAQAAGEWSPPDDPDALSEWLLRQILFFGGEDFADEEEIRAKVRIYVAPVLGLSAAALHEGDRLAGIERELAALREAISGSSPSKTG